MNAGMWSKGNRIREVYKRNQLEKQIYIQQSSPNTAYNQHASWKSGLSLNYNSSYWDFLPRMPKLRKVNNPNCTCDTCSLKRAKEMDQLLATQGEAPPYVTSWPMVAQPQHYMYNQELYPTQATQSSTLQPQYHSERSPAIIPPRGIPIIFAQPTQPQTTTHPLPARAPQQMYPTVQPESCIYPSTDFHDNLCYISPLSAFNPSPSLTSKGAADSPISRPGGVAYDHHDLPKIVAVHSLPSSPVYVREHLKKATLMPRDSNLSLFYLNESSSGNDSETQTRPTHKVCLENRFSTIEGKTSDSLVETERADAPTQRTAEEAINTEGNDMEPSKLLDKSKCMSPLGQSTKSPEQQAAQHNDKTVSDPKEDRQLEKKLYIDEETSGSEEHLTREMHVRRLLGKIKALYQDFNTEADENRKWKIFNLILEARARLEKLRVQHVHAEPVTVAEEDSNVIENVREGTNENVQITVTTMDNQKGMDVNSKNDDMTTTTSLYDVPMTTQEVDFTSCANKMSALHDVMTSSNITMEKSSVTMTLPHINKETSGDTMTSLNITMEDSCDTLTSSHITMETSRDTMTSPHFPMETTSTTMTSPHITMGESSDTMTSPHITMETSSDSTPRCASYIEPNVTLSSNITMGSESEKTSESDECTTLNHTTATPVTKAISNFTIKSNVISKTSATATATAPNVTMATKDDTMVTGDDALASYPKDSGSPAQGLEVDRSRVALNNFHQTVTKCSLKEQLLQPRIIVTLFDSVKLLNRGKKLADKEGRTEEKTTEAKNNPNRSIANSNSNEDLDSPHGKVTLRCKESQHGRLPALSTVKDPLGCTEVQQKKQEIDDSKVGESDIEDDSWTMELDESSHKAVFRRRWKRTGGTFDKKRIAFKGQIPDGDESPRSTQDEGECFSKSTEYSPPRKKRALLEVRIVDDDDDDIDEDLANDMTFSPLYTLTSGRLKRSVHDNKDLSSLTCTTDTVDSIQDRFSNDLGIVASTSNEPFQHNQSGEQEMADLDENVEESIFILERNLQLRESKIHRLNEKKEQLLDDLNRIKANSPSCVPRNL